MRHLALFIASALIVVATVVLTPSPASAVKRIWTGQIVHVSTQNIKVHSPEGDVTLSFLIVPSFKRIFSPDGKTTYQMAALKPGTWVTIYYDQHLLGARHADRIIILGTGRQMKS